MIKKGCSVELFLVIMGLELHFTAPCPKNCVCYPSPMTVSCQAQNLVSIPEGIPNSSERIFLQNNRITMLLRGQFNPFMVTLWIYSNNITYIDPMTFDGLYLLEELDLGDNRYLRSLASGTFHGLVKLHALHLYKCGLYALPDGIFNGLHNLQYLYLQDNQLEYLQDDIFMDLVNLSHLFLHGNKLWRLDQNTFRGLTTLDRLLLHQNNLQWVRRAFHDLKKLTTLFLFNNSLAELPGDALAQLGSLEFLRLNENPWECDCKARSLWDWFRRFRGSSSSVICESPKELQGRDLKALTKEDFRSCTGSESLHQTKTNTFTTSEKVSHKNHHHPHLTYEENEESELHSYNNLPVFPTESRPRHRQHGRNCSSNRHRYKTIKTGSTASKKNMIEVHKTYGKEYTSDFEQKTDIEATNPPRRKTKCTRKTTLQTPSGVQQANGIPPIHANLFFFWLVTLFAIIR
ncbi:reticulon-4 receptor-like 1 [Protopterus annectens]|uniref:reticulon-4 receptor-like 1 n=1 Tax=Protopterus annectens TaxID=7888 RepID=UPI001CF9FF2D|nr:reticulon-4 receptor-like 1 [Protopterus annectens]